MASLNTLKTKFGFLISGLIAVVLVIFALNIDSNTFVNQPTEDEAYKKGVEMTMTQLTEILTGLGVEIFGEVGEAFDPNFHNAVMHTDDENFGENTICQVFQKGFKIGEKIVRFAMVQVAN